MEDSHVAKSIARGPCTTPHCQGYPGRKVRRGLCQRCYDRALRAKRLPPPEIELTVAERFYSRTRWSNEPHPVLGTKCLLWIAGKRCAFGYGGFKLSRGSIALLAHRASWILFNGSIPDGKWVLHKCDVPACVNPSHLFLGTHDDNMRDMAVKGRAVGGVSLGENHGASVLTESDVIDIRKRRGEGQTRSSIAAIFGISPGHVGDIAKRRIWSHV